MDRTFFDIHMHAMDLSHPNLLAFDDDFYGELNELLADGGPVKRDKLPSRILFGSDYMMNLVRARSYNDYLATFIRTKQIADKIKVLLCNENAVRFMFR